MDMTLGPWRVSIQRIPPTSAKLAALYRQAAIEYAGYTVALIGTLWAVFYTLRWIVRGFRESKESQR